jgi:hypothetical protein
LIRIRRGLRLVRLGGSGERLVGHVLGRWRMAGYAPGVSGEGGR